MFNFIKEKLKSWVGKAKESIEDSAKKKEVKEKPKKEEKVKKEKPVEKTKEKVKKVEKKKRTQEELKEERKLSEEVIKDIKRTDLEIKTPEEKYEEEIKEIEKEAEEEIKEELEETKKKPGFFERFRKTFVYIITEEDFDSLFNDLEMLFLENNVALEVVESLKSRLEKELIGKEIKKTDLEQEIKSALKKALESIIIDPENLIDKIKNHKKKENKPFKILFFGINGTGKTTSIAKIVNLLQKNNISCVLAAADTFRAASIEQLQIHADRLGVKMIKHDYHSDPAAVAFDAIKYAEKNNIDVVLIDTAGRMYTKSDLLKEMEKICRVTNPNLKIFVAEAIAGNDATEQAKTFNEAIGLDGIILSKTDVDEKGGTIISVSHVTNKPIFFLGTGQEYKDLELFNKDKFIERLGL